MTTQINFNPYVQTVGNNGLFNTTSDGIRQGTALADPSTRFRLRAGLLATTETLPMWGGVGVYANIPGIVSGGTVGTTPNAALGPIVGRAVSLTDTAKPLAGFSVTDEAYGMVTSPQSPVPLIGSLGQVNWYPLGSLARICVQADPALLAYRGDPLSQQVSWDFTNQLLVPFLGTLTISSGTYNTTTGQIALTMAATPTYGPPDSMTLASLTGTGTNLATLNGTWTILSVVGSVVTLQGPTGEGSITITGGSATIGGSASQALPVKIQNILTANCEVVQYNATTGFATYNFNGAGAIIQL